MTVPDDRPTLFALSSGRPPAGVAVIRISGPHTRFALETIAGTLPEPRRASHRTLRDPADGRPIDRGLVLFFAGPASFTGEDAGELQVHGGRAVVAALLAALGGLPGLAPAEAGAFTRRAFENGRLDLTAVEGLSDLVAAETEAQRRQALRLADGALARRAADWRAGILAARAAIEADLDFSDEEDVPGSVVETALAGAAAVATDIAAVLAAGPRGERIRDGFRVAILGPPNAGKSSLLNALAGRDVAIVSERPGTTRDAIEVHLDLAGQAVIVTDTAGLRDSGDAIEVEGIRRSLARAAAADRVIWLDAAGGAPPVEVTAAGIPIAAIRSKVDGPGVRFESDPISRTPDGDAPVAVDGSTSRYPAAISLHRPETIDRLVAALADEAAAGEGGEPALVTRARQRVLLEAAARDLAAAVESDPIPTEVRAEALRRAGDAIGRLTGRIDVEEVLGAIFASFCIGK